MENSFSIHTINKGLLVSDRYEIASSIGFFGNGETFVAHDKRQDDIEIAIKVYRSYFGEERVQRYGAFAHEAMTAQALNHPNLLKVLDYGYHENATWMFKVMPLMPHNLSKFISSEDHLKFSDLLRIIEEVAKGLAHASSIGLLHGNLKPENILISKEGTVKLTDFGLVRKFNVNKSTIDYANKFIVYDYLSPWSWEDMTSQDDIYSLGILAYELATGEKPFGKIGSTSRANGVNKVPLPPFKGKGKELPQWFFDFLKTCTACEVEEGFQSYEDVLSLITSKRQTL